MEENIWKSLVSLGFGNHAPSLVHAKSGLEVEVQLPSWDCFKFRI